MKVLFIIGAPCTGKMTVGQRVKELTGFSLLTNHTTIEPVVATLGYLHWPAIREMRNTMYDTLHRLQGMGCILTMAIHYDDQDDWDCLDDVLKHFPGDEFYFVALYAPEDVRLIRAGTENRLKYKPSQRDVEAARERIRNHPVVDTNAYKQCPPQLVRWPYTAIDTSEVSATEAAERIVQEFWL